MGHSCMGMCEALSHIFCGAMAPISWFQAYRERVTPSKRGLGPYRALLQQASNGKYNSTSFEDRQRYVVRYFPDVSTPSFYPFVSFFMGVKFPTRGNLMALTIRLSETAQ
ncbi:hypothetical protein AMTR_s00150p00045780 [Amborella trichopoda]|uniref:Uncharacterized protein n=1 Tax=Amborella trichopoda TaxID=13333 RepID=W1PK96_AMBTC|nr:hypothetical protein AMTR_s00150p00045780 [Amborella trichopoda]